MREGPCQAWAAGAAEEPSRGPHLSCFFPSLSPKLNMPATNQLGRLRSVKGSVSALGMTASGHKRGAEMSQLPPMLVCVLDLLDKCPWGTEAFSLPDREAKTLMEKLGLQLGL